MEQWERDEIQQGQMPCTWEGRAICSDTGWGLTTQGAAVWPASLVISEK